MTSDSRKSGKLRCTVTPNISWANQKAELCVYRWLRAHPTFDVMSAFVGASDFISSVLSRR